VKGRFPWKIGATSFVIPATVEENVRFLAGKVDDIQLLFFESSWQARLPHTIDMNVLCDLADQYGHSYTVHLPLDLQLGADDPGLREQSIAEICRIAERCQGMSPLAYDLHLNQEEGLEPESWCDLCAQSVAVLQERLGGIGCRLCVENIDYDFGLLADFFKQCNMRVCADFGHLHHQGFACDDFFRDHDIGHVHLHGVAGGRDHQALGVDDIPFLKKMAQDMAAYEYDGVVTLELYNAKLLAESLAVLEQGWADFVVKN
jgi:sugar phosphate isomerase/epimerase